MKKAALFIGSFLIFQTLHAQQLADPSLFDFWVGKWDLTWDDGEGKTGKGTNHIVKTLDGKVIQENFEAISGNFQGFKGTSLTVYNPKNKTWKQAWADNQGGYFDFTGEVDGTKRIFATTQRNKDGKTIIQRMVFYNITTDALTWDWESSEDAGKNWKLLWRINYKKAS